MCMFSARIHSVSATKIFARDAKDGRQFLVYSMIYNSPEELAMILPLPVPKGSPEDAVRWINLEKYPTFLTEMAAGVFPPTRNKSDSPTLSGGAALKVAEVGSFEASFVPALQDFERLDKRFQLPAGVWDQLPSYRDWGFAVFKLKKGAKDVHPMAFEFPRADPKRLFFPTVHVHDGKVHARAKFDHRLYCQPGSRSVMDWQESRRPAGMFMKVDKAQGMLDPEKHCYGKVMAGMRKNADVYV